MIDPESNSNDGAELPSDDQEIVSLYGSRMTKGERERKWDELGESFKAIDQAERGGAHAQRLRHGRGHGAGGSGGRRGRGAQLR